MFGLVALLGTQQPAVAEERDAHALLDLVVRVALVQVDLERAVRHEDDVLATQPSLHVVVEDVGEVRDLERRVDAATCRLVEAARVMRIVGAVAAALGDDEVAHALRARAGRDLQRRVAPDRAQRQAARVVGRQRPLQIERFGDHA